MSKDDVVGLTPREKELKEKWEGVTDRITVNNSQFSFDSDKRLKAFIQNQFPSKEEQERYQWYREEWYRRAKEYDPGPGPLAVCCELVSTCNLGCSMCYTITEEFQDSVIGAKRMLPWPVVKAVIDESAELGVASMLFSWRGESTMWRGKDGDRRLGFADVLAYAREKGILEITSLTHGQLIDEEMAEAIVAAQPSWISYSIDGMADVYNKIRTPRNKEGTDYNAFAEVVKSIQRLTKARDEAGFTRPQIRTNTIYPAIARDPEGYRKFMEDQGVGWVTVNELLDFRGDELPEEDIVPDWGCQYPFQRLTVAANGTILPCTGAHNEEDGLVLGRYVGSPAKNVRGQGSLRIVVDYPETTLAEAWKGEKLENIRKLHRENRRTEIEPGCKHCRHGAVKHGADWIPDDWNMDEMEWEGREWRE